MKKMIVGGLMLMALVGCATPIGPIKNPVQADKLFPEKHHIQGIKHRLQWTAECAPVSIKMVLDYYGFNISLEEISSGVKQTMRATRSADIESFLNRIGLQVKHHRDTDFKKPWMKYYISNNQPVLVSGGHFGHMGQVGHMVVAVGYDDIKRDFYVIDPSQKAVVAYTYHQFHDWHMQRGYSSVMAILKKIGQSAVLPVIMILVAI